ncbi:MAG TPA: hypothetical protein PLL92_03260 [Alicycliphilus sp.]|nr:hypothetical protein [Alicycliphilus sp.]
MQHQQAAAMDSGVHGAGDAIAPLHPHFPQLAPCLTPISVDLLFNELPTQDTSTPFHQNIDMKSRLCPPCCVANPRDSYGYRCGLRLASRTNASISFRQRFDETQY